MTAHSQLAEPPVSRRRRDPVRRVLARLRERRRQELQERMPRGPRHRRSPILRRMRKRKAALALSAGVMGLSTGAVGMLSSGPATAAVTVDTPLARMPASELKASQSLKEALVQEEGVRDVVYRDVAGYPTVGVGHLVTLADGLSIGDRVGYDRILDFLEGDLAEAETAVARVVGNLPLYQHEFDALVDLVYNVGEGNLSARQSPRLVRAIAAHDYEGIARELEYRFAGGQLARGLAYRSARRMQMFMAASYGDPRGGPAGVVLASL